MKLTCFVSTLLIGFLTAVAVHGDIRTDVPGLSGDEPFLKEQWPEARLLVWSKPGSNGMATSSRSWTEYASTADYLAKKTGRPASKGPDENTDIILPDAPDDKPYVVGYVIESFRRRGGLDHPQWACRHLTIGKGAGLDGGGRPGRGGVSYNRSPSSDTGMAIHGNVRVRDGGYIYGPHFFLGDKHTFFHVAKSPEPLGKSWTVNKTKSASVTLLSKRYDLAEGVAVKSGRLVLYSKSLLGFGSGYEARVAVKKLRSASGCPAGGYIYVHKDATLEMQAGSRIGRAVVPDDPIADLRIEGLLQLGRPGDKKDAPAVIELGMGKGDGGFLRQHGGLYIRSSAKVANYCGLAITASKPDTAATADKGVSVFLEKNVDLGEVSFDYLRPGGISGVDVKTAQAAAAKAAFGEHCAAKGDGLFSKFAAIDFSGGAGTVEFVDGLKSDCKILFPHAGRLIVRGKGNRTLQSFDLKSVHAVTIADKRTEFNPKRPLNDKEKALRQKNALWGDVPGKGQLGRYGDQEWADCPIMIWARPGESGLRFLGPNWLDETGKPYFEVPLISQRKVRSDNPDIDMLLPAAGSPYFATGWGAGSNEGAPPVRHLTVEQNASYGITFNVQGNLWMKHGSGLVGKHRGRYDTEKPNIHRFLRFDGDRMNREGEFVKSDNATLSQWGHFCTGAGATVELIGRIRAAADRLYVFGKGMLIISEGSRLADGPRASIAIAPGATLALLQDARVGHATQMQRGGCAAVSVDGTLLIGLPDKPIRKDMAFPICGIRKEQLAKVVGGGGMRAGGASLIVSKQGKFVIHSADPTKARVVFRTHDPAETVVRSRSYGPCDGLAFYFAGQAILNGVVFDNVLEGGISAPADIRKTWKNVSYGKNNLAESGKLHRDLKTEIEK
jgi:hypothetical protein